jgi:AcrR family transcriptional regulator
VARRNLSAEKRRRLLPEVARTFAELGYRRTTTAELARRCAVRENILYRLWSDKKQMFIAAIDYVYDLSAEIWSTLLQRHLGSASTAERLLGYEAHHHGEFGFYRIVFAGLSESDDPEIREALRSMYCRFQRFIGEQVQAHRGGKAAAPPASQAAWAIIGLGTIASIGREFELLSSAERERLIQQVGRILLDGSGT